MIVLYLYNKIEYEKSFVNLSDFVKILGLRPKTPQHLTTQNIRPHYLSPSL